MRRTRPGWTRLSPVGAATCHGKWRHDATGLEVVHCGHPTANFPYYITADGGVTILQLAPNGRGFVHLADAQAALEARRV